MFRNITLTILVSATLAVAQSTFGSFVGTVRDPSGAVIGGASVRITNKGTSAQRTAKTDETGSFTVVNLDPGTYDVVVQAAGFQSSVHSDLVLTARQTVRVDATLGL